MCRADLLRGSTFSRLGGCLCAVWLVFAPAIAVAGGVDALLRSLQSRDLAVRLRAVAGLGALGPAGVPGLIKALQDRIWRVRGKAAGYLAKYGHQRLHLLARALRHKHPRVRLHIAQVIGALKARALRLLPAMHLAVADKEWGVRLAVVRALVKWQRPASIPILRKCLGDPYHLVRAAATSGLAAMLPRERSLLAPLLKMAADQHQAVRYEALRGLSAQRNAIPTSRHSAQLTPLFVSKLHDATWRVRWAAAHGLGLLGTAAKAAVPALRKAFFDKGRKIRGTAAIALGQIGAPALSMLPVFIKLLRDDDAMKMIVDNLFSPLGRYQVAMKLRKRIPYLKHLFAVTRAIAAYETLAVGPLKQQLKALKFPHPWFVFTLGCIGPKAYGAHRFLIKKKWHLHRQIPYRWVLLLVLSRIAPRDPIVRRILWKARKDGSSLIRIAAAKALIETNDPRFRKSKAYHAHKTNHTRIHQAASNLLIVMKTRSLTPTLFFK